MRTWLIFAFLSSTVAGQRAISADYQWTLPKGFPKPFVPADNPMSAAKVELGRYLFYDTRMSVSRIAEHPMMRLEELLPHRWAQASR